MQLGIFAKTFVRPTFEEAFAAAKGHGLDCLQFNFSCAGLPTLPDSIDPILARRIRGELEKRSMNMAAVSGTCNLIHPDWSQRAKGLVNLEILIRACGELGTSVVTLCTGTRDPNDMWRAHPENHSPGAWRDLVVALDKLLPVAQSVQAVLGVEPEPANVIDSAARARKLLDDMKSPCLKIVFDAANLLQTRTLPIQRKVLLEAIELLGADIVVGHAKDLANGPSANHVTVGRGALDYGFYLSLLKQSGFKGPLILHSLKEDEVEAAAAFVRIHLQRLSTGSSAEANALPQSRQS
jgi:sugar phosphate isomerase/epimerase